MSSLRRFFHIALTYVSGDRYAGLQALLPALLQFQNDGAAPAAEIEFR